MAHGLSEERRRVKTPTPPKINQYYRKKRVVIGGGEAGFAVSCICKESGGIELSWNNQQRSSENDVLFGEACQRQSPAALTRISIAVKPFRNLSLDSLPAFNLAAVKGRSLSRVLYVPVGGCFSCLMTNSNRENYVFSPCAST